MLLFLWRSSSLLLLCCAAPTIEENDTDARGGVTNTTRQAGILTDMEHGRRKLDKGAAAGGGLKVEIAHYPKFGMFLVVVGREWIDMEEWMDGVTMKILCSTRLRSFFKIFFMLPKAHSLTLANDSFIDFLSSGKRRGFINETVV